VGSTTGRRGASSVRGCSSAVWMTK
jgi:hypothetical protein